MTQWRQAPKTATELAHEMAILVAHIERVSEGGDPEIIVDRMLKARPDEGAAAFHGITYAWMLALMPHLHDVLKLTRDWRTKVRLGDVSYKLPRVLSAVDEEWRFRPTGARPLHLVGDR